MANDVILNKLQIFVSDTSLTSLSSKIYEERYNQ